MKRLALALFCASLALGQQPANPKADLLKLADELNAAIRSGDWNKAAELSRFLKDGTIDARNRSMAKGSADLVDQILQWLPPDTETLVVAQQAFKIPSDEPKTTPGITVMTQGYVLGLLGAIEDESMLKLLAGRPVRVAAIGARKFGDPAAKPHGLGMIAYQGCAVYSFLGEVPESILHRKADESEMGHPVWVSTGSENDNKDTDTYLAALPKPELMLVCNDRDFFTQMVSRMAVAKLPRALPADLKEWQYVNRSAPVWAIRHSRADRGADPVIGALLPGKDPEATGLAVEFGIDDGASAIMFAKSDPWADLAGSPDFHGAAASRTAGNGVWELSVANKPEASFMAVFALMAFLGFVVLV